MGCRKEVQPYFEAPLREMERVGLAGAESTVRDGVGEREGGGAAWL